MLSHASAGGTAARAGHRSHSGAALGILPPAAGDDGSGQIPSNIYVEGALDAADLAQGECQSVLPGVGAEAPEHERGADHAGADRGSEPQDIVPVRGDALIVGAAGNERRKGRPGSCRTGSVEPALGEIGNARSEPA